MHQDVLTLLLWFFLACNPSLADGNRWQYSVITAPKNDHVVSIRVARVEHFPDAYRLEMKYLNQEMVVNAFHQLNGYRVVTLVPAGEPDQFVPLIPHYMGRPWKDAWVVSNFMDDRYDVGAGVGPNDRVYVADLSDKMSNDRARAMFFDEVGLRRLHVNGWDYSIVDVDYARNPYDGYASYHNTDPLSIYTHDRSDVVGPDYTTPVDTPTWWYHGGVQAPKY